MAPAPITTVTLPAARSSAVPRTGGTITQDDLEVRFPPPIDSESEGVSLAAFQECADRLDAVIGRLELDIAAFDGPVVVGALFVFFAASLGILGGVITAIGLSISHGQPMDWLALIGTNRALTAIGAYVGAFLGCLVVGKDFPKLRKQLIWCRDRRADYHAAIRRLEAVESERIRTEDRTLMRELVESSRRPPRTWWQRGRSM